MPYLLRFDGVNDYVEADFTQPSSGQITLEIDFQMPTSPQNDRKVFSFSTANNDTRFLIRYFSNGTIGGFIIRTGVFRAIPASSSGYSGQRVKIRMEYYPARGETDFYINDQLESTSATNLGNLLNLVKVFLGRENSNFTGYSEIDLHSASVSINSTVISNYDSSASNGTGLILPDTVGSNDGTLVNFPTDNSQWVFFSGGGAISATVTELSQSFSESSSILISATLDASVTESNFDFTESSIATITNNLISISVTESSQNFSESSSVDVSSLLSAAVTESSQYFAESSTTDISANISALVTEFAQDFEDSISINLTGSFTAEVTESAIDFDDACYIQLPVQRLAPRKIISVSNRSGSTVRVRRRSTTIRVK